MKNDIALFSRLFIACQNRDGDLQQFFSHENQSTPPSLSQGNCLRSGNKAGLLKYLKSKNRDIYIKDIFQADIALIDGATLVNMFRPDTKSTFDEYVKNKILPSISKILSSVTRVDIVFDVYRDYSLKDLTRIHRGQGVRCRVRDTRNHFSDTPATTFCFNCQNLPRKLETRNQNCNYYNP